MEETVNYPGSSTNITTEMDEDFYDQYGEDDEDDVDVHELAHPVYVGWPQPHP